MSHGCPCQLDNQKFFGVQEAMLDVYGHDKIPIKCDRECRGNIIRGTGTSVNPINVPYTVQKGKVEWLNVIQQIIFYKPIRYNAYESIKSHFKKAD